MLAIGDLEVVSHPGFLLFSCIWISCTSRRHPCFLPTTLIGIITRKYEMMAGKRKKKADAQMTEISVSADGDSGETKMTETPYQWRRVGRYVLAPSRFPAFHLKCTAFLAYFELKKCTVCALFSVKWYSDDSATSFPCSAKLIPSSNLSNIVCFACFQAAT